MKRLKKKKTKYDWLKKKIYDLNPMTNRFF